MSVSTVSDIVRTRNVSTVIDQALRREGSYWTPGDRASGISLAGPLEWQAIFAIGVTLLTARHKISFGRFAASTDGNQMIHRQLSRWKLLAAMVTEARSALALPPLTRAQLASLLPLAANLFF